jgi:hypothetical protein
MGHDLAGRAIRSQSLPAGFAAVEGVLAPLSSILLGAADTVIGAVGFIIAGYPGGGFIAPGVATVGPVGVVAVGGDAASGAEQATSALPGPVLAQPPSSRPDSVQAAMPCQALMANPCGMDMPRE